MALGVLSSGWHCFFNWLTIHEIGLLADETRPVTLHVTHMRKSEGEEFVITNEPTGKK